MRNINKKILKDEFERPFAVQIEYSDWLEIERSLKLQSEGLSDSELSKYRGVITLTEDPLEFQKRIRQEWP